MVVPSKAPFSLARMYRPHSSGAAWGGDVMKMCVIMVCREEPKRNQVCVEDRLYMQYWMQAMQVCLSMTGGGAPRGGG